MPSVSTEITADHGRWTARSARRRRRRRRRVSRGAAARGAIYRIRPDGLWDTLWDSGDDCAVRSGDRAVGQPARRHRHRRQDLPRQRRSGARDAARPRHGAAGHGAAPRAVGPHRRRRPAIPESCSRCRPRRARRGTYESDVRDAGTVASWGAIRWRAVGSARRGRVFTRTRQHRDARRNLERVVEGVHERRRRTDRQPERALPAVARGARRPTASQRPGADVGDDRLPAAQPAAGGLIDHRPPAGHGVPAAVLDRRTGDRRLRGQHVGRPQPVAANGCVRRSAPSGSRPRSAGAIYQKGLQTFVWKADDDNDDRLQFDVLYRREGETAWKPLQARPVGSDLRVGHDVGARRHLLRQGRGVRRAVELSRHRARRRARERQLRHRQHAAAHRGAAGRARRRRARRSRSSSATSSRRCSGSSTRSTPAAGGSPIRRTGFRTRGARSSKSRSTTAEAARSVIIRATDAMNNVATAVAEDRRR